MAPLRVAVVGAGAFGRNHLRVYSELQLAHPELVELTGFVEPNTARREELATQFRVAAFATLDDLLDAGVSLDAASVCVPTVQHAAVAEQLLRAGVDVLIEKPFAATLDEGNQILALARERGRTVAVGHLERFNPAVTAALAALNKPMFFEAHRLSIFTPRSLDVDVVLDLMIHDLDIVLTLAGSPVKEVRAVGLPVLSPKTDIANVRIEFESGCVANFTASRVSTEQVRKLRFFQPQQYLSLDFARQELLTISVDAAAVAAALKPQVSNEGLQHPTPGLNLTKSDVPRAEPLRLELLDFLQAVRDRTQPRVTGEAGLAALAVALEINQAIAEHAERAGLA